MPNQEEEQLHLALSRDLVGLLAPEELPLFRATAAAYGKNPGAVFANKPDKEHALGFGQTGEVVALTPAILAIMTPVIAFVAQEMAAASRAGGAGGSPLGDAFTPPSVALQNRNALLEKLSGHFSLEELRTLSFRLNIDYDQVGGAGKEQYARELILYCERRGLMGELLGQCRATRPQLDWPAAAAAPRVEWSSGQLGRLRETVLQTARRANLPDGTSEEIADKLVLSLVTAYHSPEPS